MILADTVSFFDQVIAQFGKTSLIEWIGTVSGFLCVWLAARQHILNWPVSIISVVAYALLFYEGKLYGDALLQLYFLCTAVYGWYYWTKRRNEKEKPVVSLHRKDLLQVVAGIGAGWLVLSVFLEKYTDTNVPYADGFCTAVSFAAQVLMTRKVLQNWLLWIFVDICYVPLYLYKDYYLTALLYILFLALATLGYIDWRKSWKLARS